MSEKHRMIVNRYAGKIHSQGSDNREAVQSWIM